jgi:eukaryotic-like serine/threonine-protein kinase
MTTRDPRSRDVPEPTNPGDGVREPTESLNLGPDELDSPELALGTHNRPATRIESPAARTRTPLPPAPRGRRAEDPTDYLERVLGSYRVVELLGKGGMGYVYRAEHVKLGREVALKLLRADYASRRDAVTRFFQEARTVNRVRHRNIVDVTDFVELDDGTTYIVMELLTGTSLGSWAQSGIDVPRAIAVLVQICDGLGAAHQVGVVHRDLKPDNVIVVPTPDGGELVKLLDFGVAKLLNRDDEDVGFQTAAGSVIGTPAYMSPEQAGGMVIDARSDIYSLGAIMYELFSGQPMFRGRSFGEYVRKHLTEMPAPLRDTPGGAAIEPRLEAVILKCLEKDADQRYSHIFELREALLHVLGSVFGGTNPTGLAQAAGAARPLVLPLPAPLPLTPLTTSHVSQAPAPRAAPSAESAAGLPPPMTLSGEYSLPAAPPPAMPGWVWFAGGAAAVGLGVAAAIWFAGGDEPRIATRPGVPVVSAPAPAATPPPTPSPTPAAPAPAASPAPSPAPTAGEPPARPGLIEVRFDAQPSGSVFADGRPTELCRTPCAFDIDLADGGALDRRVFLVRRAGYVDAPVTVDLTGAQRAFQVNLVRAAEPVAHARDGHDSKDSDRRPARRPGKSARKDRQTVAHEPPDTSASRTAEPEAPQPPAPPKPPAIDPADTLDPFRKK